MRSPVELIPYDPAYLQQAAQTFLEVFSTAPFNETLSLNDVLTQLDSDYGRPGFGGLLVYAENAFANPIVGFSWWFDISGEELRDRWQPRFKPSENIPTPRGRGCYLTEFALLPTLRHHGLGHRLLRESLDAIEPNHDWIALQTQKFAHAALAILKSHAFEDLNLTGIQVPTRMCMIKSIRH